MCRAHLDTVVRVGLEQAALHGEGTAATHAWVVPRRKRLRRGNAAKLLKELG